MPHKTQYLSDFLLETDSLIRVFDLGRRVSKIKLSNFQKFEKSEIAYPYPYEQTAWLGLLFWSKKDSTHHNIWFFRMPLDETGFIQLSARDEFMHLLLSRLHEQMQKSNNTEALTHVLKDNPYVFKPTDDKLAIFHSKSRLILQQSPSQFFSSTYQYLQSQDYQTWEHLGIQGIADIAVRHDVKDIHSALLAAIPHIPSQVFSAFGQNLENEVIDITLAKAIALRMENTEDTHVIVAGVRALANCQSSQFKNEVLCATLKKLAANQPMILIAIAAKAWEFLEDPKMLHLFLEKLANPKIETRLFNALLVDLMFIPEFRERIMTEFRNPDRSEDLSNAVGQFFQSVTTQT